MIDCERCWTVLQKIQCKTLINVLWFGECLCLRHRGKSHRKAECLESAGEILHGNNFLWSMMKKSSVSRMQRFTYSQILCYPTSNTAWEQQLGWFKDSSQYRTLDTIDGELMGFEWNISQDSLHCSLSTKSKSSWTKWANPNTSKDELSSCRCSVTSIIWRNKDNETECIANSTLVSLFEKRFPAGRWSFLGPGSKTKWYSTDKERPGGKWDRVPELMMIKFRESGHPVFRATSPFSRGMLTSRGGGKLSIHFCADGETIETVFSTINFCQPAQYLRSSLRIVWRVR